MKEEIELTDPSREIVKTGRDLDAEVAERVMGFTRAPEPPHRTDNRAINGVLYYLPDTSWDTGQRNVVPYFSSDIEAAMQVVDRLIKEPFHYRVLTDQGGDHGSVLVEIKQLAGGSWNFIARVEAETLPLAICRAALSAVDSQ